MKNKIKEAALMGGLVIADRASGKSRALLEIINEDPHAVIVVGSELRKNQLVKRLGIIQTPKNFKVITADALEGSTLYGLIDGKIFYGDELSLAQLDRVSRYKEFRANVVTLPFPVRVIK